MTTDTTDKYTTARLSNWVWLELNRLRTEPSESIDGVLRRLLAERESAKAPPQ